jgi:hypothetical protein
LKSAKLRLQIGKSKIQNFGSIRRFFASKKAKNRIQTRLRGRRRRRALAGAPSRALAFCSGRVFEKIFCLTLAASRRFRALKVSVFRL